MRRSRFTEEQIVGILKEQEAENRPASWRGGMVSAIRRSTTGRRSTAAWTSVTRGASSSSRKRTAA